MARWTEKAKDFYERHETAVDASFFLGGFVFDVMTLSEIDDPLSILQQVAYLLIIGFFLIADLLVREGLATPPPRLTKVWEYRQLVIHFLMGSLLSVYSLFFLKSASIFSSIMFVGLLVGLMIANELKSVQRSDLNIKMGLFVICIFSFFSLLIPIGLGFVGWVPFLLATAATSLVLYGLYRLLRHRLKDPRLLRRNLTTPGGAMIVLFLAFYLIGWIPPVPLAAQKMGIYHNIEKSEGTYRLFHERASWKFWQSGDQDFYARPGDKIFFFASIFSPARFDDSVILHWRFKDPKNGWMTTDRVPMRVTGGRQAGYRGFATKANHAPGDWRVGVETTDGREIGRLSFTVIPADPAAPPPEFQIDIE